MLEACDDFEEIVYEHMFEAATVDVPALMCQREQHGIDR
jgi:hypothetical protein